MRPKENTIGVSEDKVGLEKVTEIEPKKVRICGPQGVEDILGVRPERKRNKGPGSAPFINILQKNIRQVTKKWALGGAAPQGRKKESSFGGGGGKVSVKNKKLKRKRVD